MPTLALTLQFSLFLLTAFGMGTTSASPIRIREASPQMLVPLSDDSPEKPHFPYGCVMPHGSPMKPPFLPLPPIPTVPLPPLPSPGQLLARDEDRPPRIPRPRASKSPMPPIKKLPRARASPTTENGPFTSDSVAQAEGVHEIEESHEPEPSKRPSSGCHHNTKRGEELGDPGHATLEDVSDDDETISVPCCPHEQTHDTVGELADEIEWEELADELEWEELCDDGERLHILCSRLSEPTDL